MVRNGLEPWHLLIVAVVAILLFGPQRLPDAARALGRSLRILKSEARAVKTDAAHADTASQEPPRKAEPAAPPTAHPSSDVAADRGRTAERSDD